MAEPEALARRAAIDMGVLRDLSRKVVEDVSGAVTRTALLVRTAHEMIAIATTAVIPLQEIIAGILEAQKIAPEKAGVIAAAALVLQLRIVSGESDEVARSEFKQRCDALGVAIDLLAI